MRVRCSTGVARLPCPDCDGQGEVVLTARTRSLGLEWAYCDRCGGHGDIYAYEYTEDEQRHDGERGRRHE